MNASNDFLLNLFTNEDDVRPMLKFPNLKDGIVYATDTRVLIAIPQEELALTYKTEEKYPNAEKILAGIEGIEQKKSIKVKVSDIAKELTKARIETDEYLAKCVECEGNGSVEWDYNSKKGRTYYEDFDCPACDGRGKENKEHPFPRIIISNIEDDGQSIKIQIGELDFHPFQLYRIFMVAFIKGKEEIEFLHAGANGGCLVQVDNIKMIIMPIAKIETSRK